MNFKKAARAKPRLLGHERLRMRVIVLISVLPAIIGLVAVPYIGVLGLTNEPLLVLDTANEPDERRKISIPIGHFGRSFEANVGQADIDAGFVSRGFVYDLALRRDGATFRLPNRRTENYRSQSASGDRVDCLDGMQFRCRSLTANNREVGFKLVDSNAEPEVVGLGERFDNVRYVIGNRPQAWKSNVPSYERMLHKNIYQGIDQMTSSKESETSFTYIVAGGSDPSFIRLRFFGHEAIETNPVGDLIVSLELSEPIVIKRPAAIQEIDGVTQNVEVRYQILDDDTIGFEMGSFDRSQQLTISPVMTYSTYLGGSGYESGYGIAVDGDRNVYVVGTTDSGGVNGVDDTDVFVAKYNANGTQRLFMTVFGGAGSDTGLGIRLGSNGSIHVTGVTRSTDFPIVNAAQPTFGGGSEDAFFTKIAADGSSLESSTYLGGSGDEAGYGIAVDLTGDTYITGFTDSPELSGLAGYNAFVVKFAAVGSTLAYVTILGGSGDDIGFGVEVNALGEAFVAGSTNSTDFTIANAFQPFIGGGRDAFLARLSGNGSEYIFSTYLGGSGDEDGFGIAIDPLGNSYLVGTTSSSEWSNLGEANVVVTKLSASGSDLVYRAIFGGDGDDVGFGIDLDKDDNALVTGLTTSANFSLLRPLQPIFGGKLDGFVSKLDASGTSFIFSTYLGGTEIDSANAVAVDNNNAVYVTGITFSDDFPLVQPSQPSYGGEWGLLCYKNRELRCYCCFRF